MGASGAEAAAGVADATAGSTVIASPSCCTTSHPSSVAKKASLRSSMGGADGCTSRARACAADGAAAAAGTARATGRFCTFILPALLIAFVFTLSLLSPPRWQVAWWSARFRLGTRWPHWPQCSSPPSSSCCCDDRWRVNRGDRRMPPPPVVPASEAETGALDGSGGSLRLFVLVLLIVLLFGFVTFISEEKMKEIER